MDELVAEAGLDQAQLQQWMELLPDGVLLVDARGRICWANAALQALSGLGAAQLQGLAVEQLVPPALRAQHVRQVQQLFAAPRSRAMGRGHKLDLWHAQGRAVPVDIALRQIRIAGQPHMLAVVRDISELRALHHKAQYLAMHDELTGLYSRYMLGELLSQGVEQALRSRRPMALLLIDLDDFKSVNDGHGHAAGDALLQEVARRMRAELRGSDVLARLGGDEFAVLLREQDDVRATLTVVEKLAQAIAQPWRLGHHEFHPGASIGVVFAPQDGADADLLLRHADMAMYRAKEAGRGTFAVYDAAMAHQMEEKARLQSRLKRALQHEGLRLHYQPQLCARSGRIVGAEALLRWHDAELGEVAPARFVAVAEGSGLIHGLGDWVLNAACRQLAQWREEGLAPLRLAVNISVHQLRQPGFAARLEELLALWHVPPGQLELEITETAALTHREQALALLERLAGLGVSLALDDFGIGYSSLSHLRQMPVARLKLDRSFVQGLGRQDADAVVTRAVIGLAKTLGKAVVGEGVETEAQRDFLAAEGCDELQGWLFAPALPADVLAVMLRAQV